MQSVPPSGIRRFFEIAATMKDVISLGIGEPDFVSPRPVIDAAIASLEAGKTSYTANAGLKELRDLIAADLQSRYGVTYDPGREILVTVGVSEAMPSTRLLISSKSSGVRRAKRPCRRCATGVYGCTIRLLVPSPSNC